MADNMGITIRPVIFAQNMIMAGTASKITTLDVEGALVQGMRATYLHEVLLSLASLGVEVDTAAMEWAAAAAA